MVASLRAYAAAVSAWQGALVEEVEDALRAKGIAGVDVAGRRLPKPKLELRAGLSDGLTHPAPAPGTSSGMGVARGAGSRFGYPPPPASSRASAQGLRTPSHQSSFKSHSSLSLNSEEDGDVFVVEPEPGSRPRTGTGTSGSGLSGSTDPSPFPARPAHLRRTTSEASGSLAEAAFERRARALDSAELGASPGLGAGPGAGSRPAPGSHATPRPMSYAGALAVSAGEPAPRAETPAPGSTPTEDPWDSSGPESANRAPPSQSASHSASIAPRPYRDALLPPRERIGGGDTMLAHTLMKNAAARVAGGVGAASPPSPGRLGDGIRPGDSNAGDPKNASPAVGDGAAPRAASREVSASPVRAARASSRGSSPERSPRSRALAAGVLLCRLCEREVNEEGMGVHTACCETLRDADARAKATGGSAGHRLRAAAATAAALATDRARPSRARWGTRRGNR